MPPLKPRKLLRRLSHHIQTIKAILRLLVAPLVWIARAPLLRLADHLIAKDLRGTIGEVKVVARHSSGFDSPVRTRLAKALEWRGQHSVKQRAAPNEPRKRAGRLVPPPFE